MKKKKFLHKETKHIVSRLLMLFACVILNTMLPVNHMCYAHAQNRDVQYEYNSAGRLTVVRYPDGTEIRYQYDANGNIVSGETISEQPLPDNDKQTGGGEQVGSGQTSGEQTGNGQTSGGQSENGEMNNQNLTGDTVDTSDGLHDSAEDIKNYNQFKKSRPTIKSLKHNVKKKKHYLKIHIKQISKRGIYSESGYQIKYAVNSKFKKAKSIKINKKGSITNKQWKIKKAKTYYVKVRAYMKTRTGKTIYSKYSKVKKITVKK